jgi:NADH-quinone oxidoreductase subunit C
MSQKVLERLTKELGDAIVETSSQFGDECAVVKPARWKEVATFLRDDRRCRFDHFIDLTAVDWLNRREPRYEVVLHVRSIERMHRIRLKARLHADGGANPTIETLSEVWRGADWFEREVFDMFGIEFEGHPDMRRILMYEEFVGHPLRKDYPTQKTQPLIPYREGANNDKLPPFDDWEGMPFGRQEHDRHPTGARREVDTQGEGGRNILGFEAD